MSNISGKNGHACILPDLGGNAFRFLPLRMMFAVGLWYIYYPYHVKVGFFYATFWRIFNPKWVLNFIKRFFCSYWDNYMVFIFQFVTIGYCIDWFVNIEESLHPWDIPDFIMVYDPFMCCWILFASILLLIRSSEQEVATTLDLLIRHLCAM